MDKNNTKYYLKNLDPDEVTSFLAKLKQAQVDIYIWEKESSLVDTYQVEQFDKNIKDKIFLTPTKINSQATFEHAFTKDVLIKTQLDKTQYFSNTTLHFTGIDYIIRLNNPIFKGVQRANCRLSADNKFLKVSVEIEKSKFLGNDISAGGVSFWVPENEVNNFNAGQLLHNFTVQFNNANSQIILAKIVCNNKSDFKDESGKLCNKVAVEFIDLPPHIDEQLYRQINSEMRSLAIRNGF